MTAGARLSRHLRSLGTGASSATMRFPLGVMLVIAFCGVSLAEQAGRLDAFGLTLRLMASLSGAAAVSVAATLLLESRGAGRRWVRLAGSGAAAVVGGALWWSQPFPIYAPALLTASLFAIPLAPFVGRGTGRDFWSFTLWTTVGVTLAFFSVLLFMLGVNAILEMIRYLFRTDLLADLDAYLLTIALTLVGPLFALGRIPRTETAPTGFDPDDRLVRAVRPLFEWVMAPLVLATALVLHVYMARIVFSGELPRGEIGWIVSIYAFLLLSLRIAVEPFRDETTLLRLFARFWVPILLAPMALLATALWLRIAAEGVTAERYYLGLWGSAVAATLALQLVPRWRADIRILAGVPVVLLALSTFGPWGVADTVGRSQADRIDAEFGDLFRAMPNGGSSMPAADRSRLESRLFALETVAELPRIRGLLPPAIADAPEWSAPAVQVSALRPLLGLDRSAALDMTDIVFRRERPQPLVTEGYDLAFIGQSTEVDAADNASTLGLHFDGTQLALVWNGATDSLDLGSWITHLLEGAEGSTPPPETTVRDLTTAGGRHVRVAVEHLVATGVSRLPQAATLTLLLRSAEWPAATPPPASPDDLRPASR